LRLAVSRSSATPKTERYLRLRALKRVTPMTDRKQLNVPVDPELAEAIHRAAHRAYRSKASWVREVLRQAAAS
jgi:predicted HicB family RNase H-like nuclease